MPAINSSAIGLPSAGTGQPSLEPPASQYPLGFKQDFFQSPPLPLVPGNGSQSDGVGGGICYCADTYLTHAAFCESADFAQYRIEVRQLLDFLSAFCWDHGMPDADIIAARFDLLYEHRFVQRFFRDYEGNHESIFDSRGKQILESIRAMVCDARISAEKKIAAIRNLSEGVEVCAGGVLAHLIAVDRDLAVSGDGIKAMLLKAKEEIVRGDILQEVSATFSGESRYVGNEIHFLTAVWNYIANAVGLVAIPDGRAENLDVKFLIACERKILDGLTPGRLACFVGEELQGLFVSRCAGRGCALSGLVTYRVHADFQEILDNICFEHQLESNALSLQAFVRLDGSGEGYELRSDLSLVARDLLTLMHKERLLNVAPVNCGEWLDADGSRRALFTYGGDLAWRAVPPAKPPDSFTWDAGQYAELLTMDDLRAWSQVWRPEGQAPPGAAVLQAIHSAEAATLVDVPDNWLADTRVMLAMLKKSNGEQIQRRLHGNFSYLLTGLSITDRAHLIHKYFGSGPAILALAWHWYSSPWALMRLQVHGQETFMLQLWMASGNWQAIDALLHYTDGMRYLHTGAMVVSRKIFSTLSGLPRRPALNEAMEYGHARAVEAWHRVLADPFVIDRIKTPVTTVVEINRVMKSVENNRVLTLLEGKSADGIPALAKALSNGHAAAIRAFHGLVADSAITPYIKHDMGRLLAAFTGWGVPGLLFAMEHGHAEAVRAFHAMLVEPAVLPHIVRGLPTLVAARTPAGTTGLMLATRFGWTEVIHAYHALLADPRILPHISHALPDLLAAKLSNGGPALAEALENGHAEAIKAFHQLVADPSILPHIKRRSFKKRRPFKKRPLSELLLARTATGDSGLGLALEKGRTDAVRAYNELLKDPVIRPLIIRDLPKLLAAQRRDRASGLSLALRNNHAQTILAFGDMLVDPLILPSIRHVLDKLLTARDSAGQPGLLQAIRANQSAAVAAFYQVLDRPELAAHVSGELVQTLRGLPAQHAAQMAAAAGLAGQVNAQGAERADAPDAERSDARDVERGDARDARRVNARDAGYVRASVMRFVRRMILDVGRRLIERWHRSA